MTIKDRARELTKRMYNTGDYIVKGAGGYFWANENVKGCLIEAASTEDVQVIQYAANNHFFGVKHEVKKIVI